MCIVFSANILSFLMYSSIIIKQRHIFEKQNGLRSIKITFMLENYANGVRKKYIYIMLINHDVHLRFLIVYSVHIIYIIIVICIIIKLTVNYRNYILLILFLFNL